jgi:hypothetical protein
MWNGFIWLRIVFNGGFLWTRYWNYGLHKRKGIPWIAEGLCFVELVNLLLVRHIISEFPWKLDWKSRIWHMLYWVTRIAVFTHYFFAYHYWPVARQTNTWLDHLVDYIIIHTKQYKLLFLFYFVICYSHYYYSLAFHFILLQYVHCAVSVIGAVAVDLAH